MAIGTLTEILNENYIFTNEFLCTFSRSFQKKNDTRNKILPGIPTGFSTVQNYRGKNLLVKFKIFASFKRIQFF